MRPVSTPDLRQTLPHPTPASSSRSHVLLALPLPLLASARHPSHPLLAAPHRNASRVGWLPGSRSAVLLACHVVPVKHP